MKKFNQIKDAIIAGLASAFYCYSCFTVEGHNVSSIIVGTIFMFGCIYLAMRNMDERVKEKLRERK